MGRRTVGSIESGLVLMELQPSDRLRSLFLQDAAARPIIMIGAGASQRSGIPLSDQVVEIAAKWSYCQSNGHHPDDPAVRRSDWLKWLHRHSWYQQAATAADNYSAVVHNLLQPRDNRREFFLRLIRPNVPPSQGYNDLLDVLDQRRIDTVLTTNFDRVLPDLHVTRRRPHHLELVQTPADYTKFSTSPPHPQLIYLHGSVEHYTDKNLLEEVQRLDDGLVSLLTPLLRDHPLVVIGYRGGEPSIMQHLLADQAARTNGFRRGVYWCVLQGAIVHPSVLDLHQRLSGNLQLVEISGFDEVMASIAASSRALPATVRSLAQRTSDDSSVSFDMRIADSASADELDWARVQVQIVAYCRKMHVDIPATVSRPWLEERMEQLDLLKRTSTGLRPTNAGYLLFANDPSKRIPGATCCVRLAGEPERVVSGHLWRQLDTLTDLFAEFNQPFRLKAEVSESVYPYPPLALKELLVNALVHRAYDVNEALRIDIDSHFIRLVNPGGLVEAVFIRVTTRLQEQIELGARGIRGYRNTVVADLFYGAGAMDKEGSGLPDVHAQVQRNEGRVFFGPVDEQNETFRALIYRREGDVDSTTRTATAAISKSRYFANLLEVVNIPQTAWRAPSECVNGRDVIERAKSAAVPVFSLARAFAVTTFSDLSQAENALRHSVDVDRIEPVETTRLLLQPEGRRTFVELLNRALHRHLESRGLLVDASRGRCYFRRTDDGPREITYQASLRQATRTVTKPVVSKRTDRILYWQHEAMAFGFESFGNEWALRILPGYAFTTDGNYASLHHSKIGALATRKAARDFSLQVYNHLVFWTWVLAQGQDSFELSFGDAAHVAVRGLLLNCELALPPSADAEVSEELIGKEDARLARLEEEVRSDLEDGRSPEASDAN